MRAGLSAWVGWDQLSTTAKHQSWRSKRAQEKTLTEVKAQHSWEGGTLGEQLEGMEWIIEGKPTEQTHTHFSSWWKPSLHFMSLILRKVNGASPLTNAPCPPPFLRLGHLTADMSMKCISAHQKVILTRWHVLRSVCYKRGNMVRRKVFNLSKMPVRPVTLCSTG